MRPSFEGFVHSVDSVDLGHLAGIAAADFLGLQVAGLVEVVVIEVTAAAAGWESLALELRRLAVEVETTAVAMLGLAEVCYSEAGHAETGGYLFASHAY